MSFVVYTIDIPAESWSQLVDQGVWQVIGVSLKRDWFQTLTHIAVTSLWILPVIRAGLGVRLAFLLASAAAHVGLSYWFNFQWVNNGQPNGIDGGPLGFLTWTIPALVGTAACDIVLSGRAVLTRLSCWAALVMLTGYVLSCGTRFYDIAVESPEAAVQERLALQPVWPPPGPGNVRRSDGKQAHARAAGGTSLRAATAPAGRDRPELSSAAMELLDDESPRERSRT